MAFEKIYFKKRTFSCPWDSQSSDVREEGQNISYLWSFLKTGLHEDPQIQWCYLNITVRIRRHIRSCQNKLLLPALELGSRGEGLMRAVASSFSPTSSHVQANRRPGRPAQRGCFMSMREQRPLQATKTFPAQCMSPRTPVYVGMHTGRFMTSNMSSRVKCLARLQTPGSGLWNTSSIKPSAHTSCLLNISQKMEISCSLPTCPIYTKSLRGVKYGHLWTLCVVLPLFPDVGTVLRLQSHTN